MALNPSLLPIDIIINENEKHYEALRSKRNTPKLLLFWL